MAVAVARVGRVRMVWGARGGSGARSDNRQERHDAKNRPSLVIHSLRMIRSIPSFIKTDLKFRSRPSGVPTAFR